MAEWNAGRVGPPVEHGSGTVVPLTPALLADGVTYNSSRLWLINICRPSCGFCMALLPHWEQLAKRLRHEVIVASWDAAAHPVLPTLLGVANKTPTIRALLPSPPPLSTDSTEAPPHVVEYTGTRQVDDLARFASALMPDFVSVVEDESGWDAIAARAAAERLHRLVFMTTRPAAASAPPMLKALSAAFRGLLMVVEVRIHPTVPGTIDIPQQYGVDHLPAVFGMPVLAANPTWHTEPLTHQKLTAFAAALVGVGETMRSTTPSASVTLGKQEL